MKIIEYFIGEEESVLTPVEIKCTSDALELNLAIVKEEAYNGKYEIFDDGEPEPVETPSQLDIVEAQATYTAMVTDTLLEV